MITELIGSKLERNQKWNNLGRNWTGRNWEHEQTFEINLESEEVRWDKDEEETENKFKERTLKMEQIQLQISKGLENLISSSDIKPTLTHRKRAETEKCFCSLSVEERRGHRFYEANFKDFSPRSSWSSRDIKNQSGPSGQSCCETWDKSIENLRKIWENHEVLGETH